jgi:hypothetical protein
MYPLGEYTFRVGPSRHPWRLSHSLLLGQRSNLERPVQVMAGAYPSTLLIASSTVHTGNSGKSKSSVLS